MHAARVNRRDHQRACSKALGSGSAVAYTAPAARRGRRRPAKRRGARVTAITSRGKEENITALGADAVFTKDTNEKNIE